MTVEGPTKRRILDKTKRNGLRTQPAPLVRGSSRRIMSMRFQPANISLINRRVSHWAVIGPAVQNPCSKLTSGIMFSLRRPSTVHGSARTVLAFKGSLRRAKQRRALDCCAPFRPDGNRDGRRRREHYTVLWKPPKQNLSATHA